MPDDISKEAHQSIDDALELRLYWRQGRGEDYTRILHKLTTNADRATAALNALLLMYEIEQQGDLPDTQLSHGLQVRRALINAIDEALMTTGHLDSDRVEEYTNALHGIPADRRDIVLAAMTAIQDVSDALRKDNDQ